MEAREEKHYCVVCNEEYTGTFAETDAAVCCPQFSCNNCGVEYYDEYEADECCASCSWCGCSTEDCCSCGSCGGCGCNCDDCGCYEAEVGDDVNVEGFDNEKEVAERFRINYMRFLPQYAADYYLLLHMHQIKKSPKAKKMLEEMAEELAPEFATYLDLACGGEIRYAKVEQYPTMFEVSPGRERRGTRGLAWDLWPSWKTLPERTEYAIRVFEHDDFWGGGYGGPAWASIAKTLKLRVDGVIDDIMWLDRVWNLQHNGGIALNKVYRFSEVREFHDVLNAHGNDDYETLMKYASQEVVNMWQYKNWSWDHWAHEVGDKLLTPDRVFQSFIEEKSSNWRGQLRWQNRFTSE